MTERDHRGAAEHAWQRQHQCRPPVTSHETGETTGQRNNAGQHDDTREASVSKAAEALREHPHRIDPFGLERDFVQGRAQKLGERQRMRLHGNRRGKQPREHRLPPKARVQDA